MTPHIRCPVCDRAVTEQRMVWQSGTDLRRGHCDNSVTQETPRANGSSPEIVEALEIMVKKEKKKAKVKLRE